MSNLYATLADVRSYGAAGQNADGSFVDPYKDDQLLEDAIGPYSRAIDTHCGWSFYEEILTDQVFTNSRSTASRINVDENGQLWLKTRKPTLQSVNAIAFKVQWSQSWQTIDVANAMLDTLAPEQYPTENSFKLGLASESGAWFGYRAGAPLWIQATYTGGYTSIPEPIKRACAEWVYYDYKLRENMPTMAAGFVGMPMVSIRPLKIPPHIEKLLWDWRKVVT